MSWPPYIGIMENAQCPKCKGFTQQKVVKRGVRECLGCHTVFNLKDVERWQGRKLIKPSSPA